MIAKINKKNTIKNISPVRILFAHHDDQVLTMLDEMFEHQRNRGQLKIEFTKDGQQFLKNLSSDEFDIIVLDQDLTQINFPKVFHDLSRIYPNSKVLFLMNEFNERIVNANDLSNVQFIKKPFTQKGLIKKIAEIKRASKYEMQNMNLAGLLLILSVIKNKVALCILNDETGDSAEVFIKDKTIINVTVDRGELHLEGFKALKDLLNWSRFESRYSDAPFPEGKNLRSDSMEVVYKHLESPHLEESKSKTLKTTTYFKTLSAEKQQRLRELLAHVPQYFDDDFIMNAFCNKDFQFYAQLKNPKYNELLYRIGDSILDNFKTGISVFKNEFVQFYSTELPGLAFMQLHKIDEHLWYLTISSQKAEMPKEMLALVNSFSKSTQSIINKSMNVYEFLN